MPAEVAAIVLAAGRASRFGAGADTSKVYALLDGKALVAHVVGAAAASRASPVIVVTGHAAHRAAAALAGERPDVVVENADYPDGLASSLRAGLSRVPARCAGALVMLADMPLVATATLDALIESFVGGSCDAAVPKFGDRCGNPVLLGRSLFARAMRLRGDEGARRLIRGDGVRVRECPVDDGGILMDVDTAEALDGLRPR